MRIPSLLPRLLSRVAALALSTFALACADETGERGPDLDASAPGSSGGAGTGGSVGAGGAGAGGRSTGGRSTGGTPGSEAGSDGGLSPFCASLARGASFESRDLEWCTVGWYGDSGPPGPEEDPSLYCHWWIQFDGARATAVVEDYGFGEAYACDGNRVEIERNDPATWDPERRVLTYLEVEFIESPAADAGR